MTSITEICHFPILQVRTMKWTSLTKSSVVGTTVFKEVLGENPCLPQLYQYLESEWQSPPTPSLLRPPPFTRSTLGIILDFKVDELAFANAAETWIPCPITCLCRFWGTSLENTILPSAARCHVLGFHQCHT